MIKPRTIQIPISLNRFKQDIRNMSLGNIIELHNVIEEVLLEYEDKKLSTDPKFKKEIELSRKEYKLGKYKRLREVYKDN